MKRPTLTTWILIALVAGIAFGAAFPAPAREMGLLGTVFLRLIKSIIAPLLFGTLVSGIAGTGNVKTMGRIGGKAILYFEVVTTIALFVGLGAVNLVKPGVGVQLERGTAPAVAQTSTNFGQILEHTFPTSIIDSMARGEVLQLVVFCFIFGTACAAIGAKARPVVEFCSSLAEVMFRYTNYVMLFAPFGVFGAMAATVGDKGLRVLVNLGKLVLTLYGAQAFFVVVVFGAVTMIALHTSRPRAFSAGVFDRFERSRAAAGAREHGKVRCPETYRGVRVADRVQLQSGWIDVVSFARRDLRRTSGGNSHAVRHPVGDAAYPDVDQQGRSRRAARVARDSRRNAGVI